MSFSLPWYFYWIIPTVIILPILGRLIEAWLDSRRYARAGLQDVKRMHWRDFEQYLAHLFRSLGYQVELTPPSGDNGVDVILTDRQGRRTAVQAKHWRNKRVGSPEIQKTVGGAKYYNCEHVLVVTTSNYTDQAREFARKTGVTLWAIKELGDAMAAVTAPGAAAALTAAPMPATPIARSPISQPARRTPPAPSGPYPAVKPVPPARPQVARAISQSAPDCPTCASAMNLRAIQGRQVWLCSRSPACKGFKFKD